MAEALDKDVSTHSPNSQSLQKILERLDSIEKEVQKQNTKPTYTQAAQKTVGQEIPVPTRIHSEITIRPGTQTGQLANRTPAQLMEALKKKTPLLPKRNKSSQKTTLRRYYNLSGNSSSQDSARGKQGLDPSCLYSRGQDITQNLSSASPWGADKRLQARKPGGNKKDNLLPKPWDGK